MLIKNERKFKILLIQDNQNDIILTQRVFKRIGANIQLNIIRSGTEAYQIFSKQGNLYPIPNLILLDLNLPGIKGVDILRAIKNHSIYRAIPVVILTTSNRDNEIQQVYQNNASTYLMKPFGIQQFQKLLIVFKDYWINYAKIHQIEE